MNSKYSSKFKHFRIQMRFKLEQIQFKHMYTIDIYVVLILQSESKYNKIVPMQTMSNPKILCLPPVANTLRDLDMRFTWMVHIIIILAVTESH